MSQDNKEKDIQDTDVKKDKKTENNDEISMNEAKDVAGGFRMSRGQH